jgi:archaemetzincin
VRFVLLVPDLEVDEGTVAAVQRTLPHVLGMPVRAGGAFPNPVAAYDVRRDQYDSSVLLVALATRTPADGGWILGLTERDLYVPMLTFVFGQAQLAGHVAIVSLARLHQEFYGLPADAELLRQRVVKEALHEMGHALGLVHCVERTCAMSLSTQVEQVDAKFPELCESCRTLLREGEPLGGGTAGDGSA